MRGFSRDLASPSFNDGPPAWFRLDGVQVELRPLEARAPSVGIARAVVINAALRRLYPISCTLQVDECILARFRARAFLPGRRTTAKRALDLSAADAGKSFCHFSLIAHRDQVLMRRNAFDQQPSKIALRFLVSAPIVCPGEFPQSNVERFQVLPFRACPLPRWCRFALVPLDSA